MKVRLRPHPPRLALTLIELLVVLAILAVLVGLLLPAVQRVRDASLRVRCGNNLHQIGLAAVSYHDVQNSFPPGSCSPLGPNRTCSLAGWLTLLLPYVEQQNLWAQTVAAYRQSSSPFRNPPHVGLATVLPAFACPADPRTAQVQFAPRDRFRVALTCYLGVSGQDLYSRDGVLFLDSRTRIADITDGTSNTLLAGERPASADLQYGWWYAGAGQIFTGSADTVLGVREQNVLPITPTSCPPGTYSFAPGQLDDQCAMFHFWSPHVGGAFFLFADGSAHFLRYDAAAVLPSLASRAGGEAVSLSY